MSFSTIFLKIHFQLGLYSHNTLDLFERDLLANLKKTVFYGLLAVCILFILVGSLYFLAGTFSIPIQNPNRYASIPHSDDVFLQADFSPEPAVSSSMKSDSSDNEFSWYYDGTVHSFTYSGPIELYDYYSNKSHDRSDYNQYVLSEYDRWAIQKLADYFKQYGQKKGHSEEQITGNVISFVQSIHYTSDYESTGQEEYPRYPVETLTDKTGDCEDTVILAAAILNELGYDPILVLVPQHMVLGIRDTGNYSGQFYEYNGEKYYYVETTSFGHQVGVVPESVDPTLIEIYPLVQIPKMSASVSSVKENSDADYSYYSVYCRFLNDGPGIGKNISMTIHGGTAVENSSGLNQTVYIGNISEDGKKSVHLTIRVPNNSGSVYFIVTGDNFESFTVSDF